MGLQDICGRIVFMFRSFRNLPPRKKQTFARTRVTVLTFRKASNIGEVWNPACCHGDKTVNSFIRGRLLESYCKESNDSDKIWLRYIFSFNLTTIWFSV